VAEVVHDALDHQNSVLVVQDVPDTEINLASVIFVEAGTVVPHVCENPEQAARHAQDFGTTGQTTQGQQRFAQSIAFSNK
jgi:hypothetical protein